MWFISGEKKPWIWLKPGKQFIVGRKDADISIPDDRSVSRKHATIEVILPTMSQLESLDQPSTISITDLSKTGTFIDNCPIQSQSSLHQEAQLKFGNDKHCYRIHHIKVVACFTGLSSAEKVRFQATACTLGGLIDCVSGTKDIKATSEFSPSCTHLVTKTLRATEKVYLALIHGIPIVDVRWLNDLEQDALANSTPFFDLPDEANYVPVTSEEQLKGFTFEPNIKRKTVFKGVTFITFSKTQMNTYKNIICSASGNILFFCSETRTTNDFKTLLKKHSQPILLEPDQFNSSLTSYISIAHSAGIPVFNLSKLPAAILAADPQILQSSVEKKKVANVSNSYADSMLSMINETKMCPVMGTSDPSISSCPKTPPLEQKKDSVIPNCDDFLSLLVNSSFSSSTPTSKTYISQPRTPPLPVSHSKETTPQKIPDSVPQKKSLRSILSQFSSPFPSFDSQESSNKVESTSSLKLQTGHSIAKVKVEVKKEVEEVEEKQELDDNMFLRLSYNTQPEIELLEVEEEHEKVNEVEKVDLTEIENESPQMDQVSKSNPCHEKNIGTPLKSSKGLQNEDVKTIPIISSEPAISELNSSSLCTVVFMSLVKSPSTTRKPTFELGIPGNVKRFKKAFIVGEDSHSLMEIIGGDQLMPHGKIKERNYSSMLTSTKSFRNDLRGGKIASAETGFSPQRNSRNIQRTPRVCDESEKNTKASHKPILPSNALHIGLIDKEDNEDEEEEEKFS